MYLRTLTFLLALIAAVPVAAQEMRPEEAKQFVAGKIFSYTCFEGTKGTGRISVDGSVAGTIQVGGAGPVRYASLPTGTIRVTSTSVCASVRGLFFEPCFVVQKTSATSFRGSISGLGFAYCDFYRRNPRLEMAKANAAPRPIHSAVILRRSQE